MGQNAKIAFNFLLDFNLTLNSYRRGRPSQIFLHHPKTLEAINLKIVDFKDTSLRHILQAQTVC